MIAASHLSSFLLIAGLILAAVGFRLVKHSDRSSWLGDEQQHIDRVVGIVLLVLGIVSLVLGLASMIRIPPMTF